MSQIKVINQRARRIGCSRRRKLRFVHPKVVLSHPKLLFLPRMLWNNWRSWCNFSKRTRVSFFNHSFNAKHSQSSNFRSQPRRNFPKDRLGVKATGAQVPLSSTKTPQPRRIYMSRRCIGYEIHTFWSPRATAHRGMKQLFWALTQKLLNRLRSFN